jgi:hypothetical protein
VINDSRAAKVFNHALMALGFHGLEKHGFRVVQDGASPRWGHVIGTSPFVSYHPLGKNQNGGRLYVADAAPLWPIASGGQGDAPTARANVVIEDAVLNVLDDIRGRYFVEYDGTDVDGAGNQYLEINRVLNEEYESTSLASGYTGVRVNDGGDVKNITIRQACIPFYGDETTITPRGPFEMLLYMLLSTGSPGYNHATYDVLPLTLSLAVQASLVDIQSFLDADAAIMTNELAHRRLWPIPEDTNWTELVRAECQLFGYVLRQDPKTGQIGLVNVLTPDTDGYDVTIDDSRGVNPVHYPDLVMEMGTVVNQYRIKTKHPISDDYAQTEFVFTDTLSRDGYELAKEIEIKHDGLYLREAGSSIQALLAANFIGRPLRFISPTVTCPLDRTLMRRIAVGDIVRYVNPRMMDLLGTGDRGLDCLATVLNAGWDYGMWRGKAVLLLHAQYQNYGIPWAPSALVDIDAANGGWDATNKRLTLEALHYGESGEPDDGSAFAAGDELLIIERAPANPANVKSWQVTVDSAYETDGAELLTLDAGTTLTGWDAAREYIVTYADWTQVQAGQKTEGTWQANATTNLLDSGSGNDAPQKWG